MWKHEMILAVGILTLSLSDNSFEQNCHLSNAEITQCKTEVDSLTRKTVYIAVDKEAENVGGQIALMRKYNQITLDSVPDDLDTRFVVAFIVEQNGQITGERIVRDKTGSVGKQMIKIAKSFKWTPAECDGRKVPTLVKLPLQMCLR